MYHYFIKKTSKWAFERLSMQDYESLLNKSAENVYHSFAGNHALGGIRDSKSALRIWFQRLFRLFPDLKFDVQDIIVTGMPWNTRVAIVWKDHGTTSDRMAYTNEGVHIMELKWGKLVSLKARLDTQHLEKTLNRMASNGIDEAKAEPIKG